MYAVVSREKIKLPPGTVMQMPGTWQDYCAMRDGRGDGSIPRIKFRNLHSARQTVLRTDYNCLVMKANRKAHISINIYTLFLTNCQAVSPE